MANNEAGAPPTKDEVLAQLDALARQEKLSRLEELAAGYETYGKTAEAAETRVQIAELTAEDVAYLVAAPLSRKRPAR